MDGTDGSTPLTTQLKTAMKMPSWNDDTLIKQLPPGIIFKLCGLLDAYKKWPDLMAVFKDQHGNLLYHAENAVRLACEKSPTRALLHMLSFERMTVKGLRESFHEAKLPRFADMLCTESSQPVPNRAGAEELAPTPSPSNSPKPTAISHRDSTVSTTLATTCEDSEKKDCCEAGSKDVEFELSVRHSLQAGYPCNFTYDELNRATYGFNSTSLVGRGGFGEVFRGKSDVGPIAVKRLMKNDVSLPHGQQFMVEVEILSRFKHENILPLFGFSTSGGYHCIVSAYMQNGSLEDRLACLNNTPPLSAKQRISIAQGTVCGIAHLHTFEITPVVHRDVKSANILLDGHFVAKLADCALARASSASDPLNSSTQTVHVIGTSIYMAPEYKQSGTISVLLDSFSFGVVLLELLTGIPVYDCNRDDPDLPTHVTENLPSNGIIGLVDRTAGWEQTLATEIYELSTRCRDIKRRRPKITEILPGVEKWQNNHSAAR